ncbi:hypothetical protein GCM10023205_23190 [Yinghuangia aomiensis]|uniref:Uncharacterized protein n=1 Tax=Yinghuangia aomiensis TaxID=676205 RepID=A0ABP9H6A6_9ACTN
MTNQYETPEAESLSSAMHAATSAFQPPTAALVRGGMARGKKFQSLRRMQVAGAAFAVVAAAGVGTAVLSTSSGGDQKASVAAQPPAVSQAAPQQAPQPAKLTAQAALDALKQLLPAGYTVSDVKLRDADTGARGDTSVSVEALVDPGDGKATTLYLALRPGATAGDNACWTFTAGTGIWCKNETLPNGTLRLEQNREYPASESTADGKAGINGRGAKVWSVSLSRTDGVAVYANTTNAAGEKTGKDVRTDPPLTTDQLKAIVTAPVWNTLAGPDSMASVQMPKSGDRPQTKDLPDPEKAAAGAAAANGGAGKNG